MGNCLGALRRASKRRNQEKTYPIEILPIEVWLQVFENLNDPVDLENVSNASLFFRNILLPQRVLFLLPKVWKILDMKYHQSGPSSHPSEKKISIYFIKQSQACNSCHRWTASWWGPATLNFRSVCTSWMLSVDKILQDLPNYSTSMQDSREIKICKSRELQCQIVEDDRKDTKSFLRRLLSSHPPNQGRNPFINRTIQLVLNTNGRHHFRKEVFEILNTYGHHIWYCEVAIGCTYLAYLKFQGLMVLMPNLKALKITHGGPYNPSDEEFEELEKWIEWYPMPKFRDIEVLVLDGLPFPIFSEAVRSNNHVQVLKVHPAADIEDAVIANMSFPNLTELSMKSYLNQKTENIIYNMPRLSKLYFDFQLCFSVSWADIFTVLEASWADSLTSLVLELPRVLTKKEQNGIIQKSPTLRLRLHRLKEIQLVIKNLTSLDFLLPMKNSLEILDLTMLYEIEKEEKELLMLALESGQVIKLLSCSDRVLESNIWTVFPQLKTVRLAEEFEGSQTELDHANLKPKVYTRRDWEIKN